MIRRDRRRRHHDLRAVRLQHVLLVQADLVRADEDACVPALLGDHGQSHAGVATGRLDDRATGLQQPLLLGSIDHLGRDPVLDRPARVEVLDLGQHGGLNALGDMVQLHQGGVAHDVDDGFCVAHAFSPWKR